MMKEARAVVTAEIRMHMLDAGTPDIMFTVKLVSQTARPDGLVTRYMFTTDLPDSSMYEVTITHKRMYLKVYSLISQKEVPYE